ncbi:DUF6234 family protein [Streptomyces sp. NPDC057638]|uniref:DUF6234 family protein n=1 Tax=Streptomyces sp. NPDC057638 TaxID=3346190 RepID=UPI0036C8266C
MTTKNPPDPQIPESPENPRPHARKTRGTPARAPEGQRALALALILAELAAVGLVILFWAMTFWSWDPQSHGERPHSHLTKAVTVAVVALAIAAVAAIRRARTVAVSQIATALAIGVLVIITNDLGDRAYETSYREACVAGMGGAACEDALRPGH